MSNRSCCLVKVFVHMTHCTVGYNCKWKYRIWNNHDRPTTHLNSVLMLNPNMTTFLFCFVCFLLLKNKTKQNETKKKKKNLNVCILHSPSALLSLNRPTQCVSVLCVINPCNKTIRHWTLDLESILQQIYMLFNLKTHNVFSIGLGLLPRGGALT